MPSTGSTFVVNGTALNKITANVVNLPGGLERAVDVSDSLTALVEESLIAEANQRQLELMVPSFTFICILLTLGIPGNIFAIVIFLTKLKKTVARYLILTLAVSDLISCAIAMPSELDIMTRYFDFDQDAYCRFFRFVAYFTNNISSLTLVAIALERHRLICTPWKRKFTPRISRNICYFNIFLAAVSSLPIVFMYGTHTVNLGKYPSNATAAIMQEAIYMPENSTQIFNATIKVSEQFVVYGKTCSINDDVIATKFPFFVIIAYISITVIVYVLLTVLYAMIGRSLFVRRRESIVQNTQNQGRSRHRARQVTIMGFTLTLVYQICYLPCFILLVLNLAQPELYGSLSTGGKMVYIVLLKSYLINCSIDPFIYCVFNRSVRQMLCQKCSNSRKASDTPQLKCSINSM